MKLLFTIIQDKDAPDLLDVLMENGFRATKLSSTGGFLRSGNTTLLIGVEEKEVEAVLSLIARTCKKREQADPVSIASFVKGEIDARTEKIMIGGANIFSIDVERFEKI